MAQDEEGAQERISHELIQTIIYGNRSLNLSESFPETHNVQLLKSIAHISRF